MNDKQKSLFFKTHELKQNKMIIKIMALALISYPMLLIATALGILSGYVNNYFFELVAMVCISLIFSWVVLKFDPYAPYVKLILLITFEIVIFMLSINIKISMGITYLLVPLLSSIYLNRKSTTISVITCYVVMVLSLYIRSRVMLPFEGKISGNAWFMAYGTGFTLEYFMVSSALIFLTNNNNILVSTDYNLTKLQISTQTIITGSFIELLNKNCGVDEFHPKRCSEYVKLICGYLRNKKEFSDVLTEEYINYIVTATLVHDIGMWVIPDRILHKKTPLTELERQQYKLHTVQGEELFRQNMQNVDKQYLETCCDVILYHHEQWNGQGYPYQITETAIPLAARIVHAANELDKLTYGINTDRKYTFSEAVDVIKKMGGRELDPTIASIIWENRDEFMYLYEKIKLTM